MLNPIKDCFTSALFGLQLQRPYYTIASLFGEILDTFSANDDVDFAVSHIDATSTVFKLDGVGVSISPRNIQVFTNINIDKEVAEIADLDTTKPVVANGWGAPIDSTEIVVVESVKGLKEQFLADAKQIFDILSVVLEPVDPFIRFFGYIEDYLIPINKYDWKVMDAFDKGASIIKGADLHDKTARNRYILSRDEEDKVSECLTFQMMRPHSMGASDTTYAFGHFDYQHWFNGKSSIKNHALDNEVVTLGSGLSQLIKENKILDVKKKG